MSLPSSNFDPFWYWISERQSIYLKRLAGAPREYWTKDEILRTYAFCNVFRENDRVTRWINEHMRKPYADHPNLWFLMCLARQINWPPTLAETLVESGLPDRWDPARACVSMRYRAQHGKKVYTGAYMLRGDIQKNDGTLNDKPSYTCFKVLDPVWKVGQGEYHGMPEQGEPFSSIQKVTEWLENFHGWGGFLAYEVATDLRHTRYLCNAPDIMTWANPGPGAKRGLNRLFGRPVKKDLRREQAIEEMQYLLSESRKNLPNWVRPDAVNFDTTGSSGGNGRTNKWELKAQLEMRDIEHSLCETDKYLRVKLGEGRPRATFQPYSTRSSDREDEG
jgi:hypothetical protein